MTDFRAVSWSDDEDITSAKLNQMSTNDTYLLENIVPMAYDYLGAVKTTGLKIAAGVTAIPPSTSREITQAIYFPSGFFTQNSRPVVTASLATIGPSRVFIVIKGFGGSSARPDNTGFTVVINAAPLDEKTTNFNPVLAHLHWQAIGY